MGKRANIARTRYAAEAAERELRRQTVLAERLEETRRRGLSPEERAAEDAAAAEAQAAKAAQSERDIANLTKVMPAIVGSAIAAGAAGIWGVLALWVVVIAIWTVIKRRKDHDAAQRRAEEEAAEAARMQDEQARQAQLQYHVAMLCRADPRFSRLVDEWNRIPPTRPVDKARNEAAQADRLIIIDQYAAQFAEAERTGQPVPDHGATMRNPAEAERAWDARNLSLSVTAAGP